MSDEAQSAPESEVSNDAFDADPEVKKHEQERKNECVQMILDNIDALRDSWGDVNEFDHALAYVALSITSELKPDDAADIGDIGLAVEHETLAQ